MAITVNGNVYHDMELLGSGYHGIVFKVERNGKTYAAKIPRKYGDEEYREMKEGADSGGLEPPKRSAYEEIEDEISMIEVLQKKMPKWHPNINRIIEYGEATLSEDLFKQFDLEGTEPHPVIISELAEVLDEETFDINNEWVSLLVDMLSAHIALEQVGYIYTDLNPANIGYNRKRNRYVIIDLGNMALVKESNIHTIPGSFYFPFSVMKDRVSDTNRKYYDIFLNVVDTLGITTKREEKPIDQMSLSELRQSVKREKPKEYNSFIDVAVEITRNIPFKDFYITDVNSIKLYKDGEVVKTYPRKD